MEQPDKHPAGPDQPYRPDRESLADYVKRKETEANLEKLAGRLSGKARQRGGSAREAITPDVSTPDVSTPDISIPGISMPDLSFEKFEEKRRGQ